MLGELSCFLFILYEILHLISNMAFLYIYNIMHIPVWNCHDIVFTAASVTIHHRKNAGSNSDVTYIDVGNLATWRFSSLLCMQ